MQIDLLIFLLWLLGSSFPKCSDKQHDVTPPSIVSISYKEIPDSLIQSMYVEDSRQHTEERYMCLLDASRMFQSMKHVWGKDKLRQIYHTFPSITYVVNDNGEIEDDYVTYYRRKNAGIYDWGIDTISRNQLLDYLKANHINFHSIIRRDYDVCDRFTGIYINWGPPVRQFCGERYEKFLDAMGYTKEQLPKFKYLDLITQAFLDYDRRHQPMKNFERTYYY